MKKLFKILLIMATLHAMGSCEKMETNGDFAGMWQLTEWKDLSDSRIVADKYSKIFYCVQLDLMDFRSNDSYLARFRRTADSLFIGTVYHGAGDNIVSIEELAKFGVPADGKFAIDRLNKQALVLRSDDALLTFRKL